MKRTSQFLCVVLACLGAPALAGTPNDHASNNHHKPAALAAPTSTGMPHDHGSKSAAHATQKDAVEVRQVNEFFGPSTIYISPDAAKFVGRRGDFICMCQKPTWKVLVLTKADNKGIEYDLDFWSHHGLGAMNAKESLKKGTESTVFDPALKIDCVNKVVKAGGRYWGTNDSTIFRAAEKRQLKEVRFKSSKSIVLTNEVQDFLRGLFNLHNLSGVPLELVTECTDKSIVQTYSTMRVSNIKVDSSFFDYPKGYKIAADKGELLIGKQQRKSAEDFINTLIDEEPETHGKPGITIHLPHAIAD